MMQDGMLACAFSKWRSTENESLKFSHFSRKRKLKFELHACSNVKCALQCVRGARCFSSATSADGWVPPPVPVTVYNNETSRVRFQILYLVFGHKKCLAAVQYINCPTVDIVYDHSTILSFWLQANKWARFFLVIVYCRPIGSM